MIAGPPGKREEEKGPEGDAGREERRHRWNGRKREGEEAKERERERERKGESKRKKERERGRARRGVIGRARAASWAQTGQTKGKLLALDFSP